MRVFLVGFSTLVAAVYVAFALTIHRQTSLAVEPDIIDLATSPCISHPEAALSAIGRSFASGNYSDAIGPLLERSLTEVPSSYRAVFLHTVYRANRLEQPALIRKGFETAIGRFPANGRLHLTYARWLLSTRGGDDEEVLHLAAEHVKKAMLFEEELVSSGLALLRWGGVDTKEWSALIPETLPARRHLLRTLVRYGYRNEALDMLEKLLCTETDVELFRDASSWTLQWGEPQLALQAARRWREHEMASGKTGLALARATLALVQAHMALGDPDAAHAVVSDTLELMEKLPRATRPARLELLNGMGYEYLRAGRTVLARSSFLKARSLAPYDTTCSLGLARAYRQEGDNSAAEVQYRRVLELDRDNAEAQQELQKLLKENW